MQGVRVSLLQLMTNKGAFSDCFLIQAPPQHHTKGRGARRQANGAADLGDRKHQPELHANGIFNVLLFTPFSAKKILLVNAKF